MSEVIVMSERNYQFRERMLEIHKKNRRMPFAVCSENQVEITDGWKIIIPENADRILYTAACDLVDYFFISMGVSVTLTTDKTQKNAIIYTPDSTIAEGDYQIIVKEDFITLKGGNSRALMQAGFYLEDLMNFAEGPFIDIQNTAHSPLYKTRMVHSGFGLDDFPNEHLLAIAHAGYTAILLFVRGSDMSSAGPRDFNDIIYRAEGYGLDVYMYSYLRNEAYPEGEEGQAFYNELYGGIFKKHPGFKGVVLVGESCEFRSRDTNTSMMFRRENMDENGKKKVDKPNPGWWPCYDYPLLLNMIKNALPEDKELILWTYNWGKQPEKPRLELIRNIPEGITLEVTFEMFERLEREGVTDVIADYAIHFEGSGKYFDSEAKEAARRNIKLYSMVNTAGATWDMGVIPYVPVPQQWARRYKSMKKYHDECGLTGLMESHHFGIYPSFITDFAKWMFHSPDSDINEVLTRIATRDFSKDTAPKVLEAWEYLSEGIRYTVTNNNDQYGPYRIGPAYPLLFRKDYTIPSVPWARFGGNAICRPKYRYPLETEEDFARINHEINYNSIACELYDKGADILFSVIDKIHPTKKEEAKRMATLARFMARSASTTVNTKKWHLARKNKDYATMYKVGLAEIENAKSTIPLVEFDSRLGWEPSMEYMCDREHIEWKIATTLEVLETEIKPLI